MKADRNIVIIMSSVGSNRHYMSKDVVYTSSNTPYLKIAGDNCSIVMVSPSSNASIRLTSFSISLIFPGHK